MYHFRRNKSELIVLTGAIYSFVAYLTAFTLEILFLIDLTRRSNEILSTFSTPTSTSPVTAAPRSSLSSSSSSSAAAGLLSNNVNINHNDNDYQTATLFDRLTLESMQAHITISCLTISILYFIVFISSLSLIVALILRSTFMLLIWMCAMTTMYLPEFGLVIYVSVYSWGVDTRNGQTELIFYLFRAVLNLIFVYRARKLFKQWNYEKNFFRLKSGSSGAFSTGAHQFAHSSAYDSPYFIGRGSSCGVGGCGDSLSTTINPIFSSSTLNLNCYDFVRDQYNQHSTTHGPGPTSREASPTTVDSAYGFSSSDAACDNNSSNNNNNNNNNNNSNSNIHSPGRNRAPSAATGATELYSRERQGADRGFSGAGGRVKSSHNLTDATNQYSGTSNKSIGQFYLGDGESVQKRPSGLHQHQRQLSQLSINDDFPDYELDIDYRTLGKSAPKQQHNSSVSRDHQEASPNRGQYRAYQQPSTTGQRFNPHLDEPLNYNNHHHHHHHHHRQQQQQRRRRQQQQQQHQQQQLSPPIRMKSGNSAMTRSHDDLAYSTQSLDRRNSKDFMPTEQVVLRPLGHQPFEYLQRPGSMSNLNYN